MTTRGQGATSQVRHKLRAALGRDPRVFFVGYDCCLERGPRVKPEGSAVFVKADCEFGSCHRLPVGRAALFNRFGQSG